MEKELAVATRLVAEGDSFAAQRKAALEEELGKLKERRAAFEAAFAATQAKPYWTDDKIWAAVVAAITAVLLILGRYGLIQNITTAMVAIFTLMTVVNVVMLQQTPVWAITWNDIVNGLSFRLPPRDTPGGKNALMTALKTFGIIGVGATELVAYPYWCLEKGYARFTGPRDSSSAWAMRARGWMNVMRWDAWCSMVVYTVATIAFYLLGAAILGRTGLVPEDRDLIRTLNVMYEPVFGAGRGRCS